MAVDLGSNGGQAPGRVAIDLVRPDRATIALAVETLQGGGVVAYPTEHLYGLACDPDNPQAMARLFAIKGRALHKPLPVIVADIAMTDRWRAGPIPGSAAALMTDWPAGLTLILDANDTLPAGLRAEDGSMAVRLLETGVAGVLSAAFGGPIPATSANRSGAEASGDLAPVLALEGLDLILDGGRLPVGGRSTLLDIRQTPWKIVRQGQADRAVLDCAGPLATE